MPIPRKWEKIDNNNNNKIKTWDREIKIGEKVGKRERKRMNKTVHGKWSIYDNANNSDEEENGVKFCSVYFETWEMYEKENVDWERERDACLHIPKVCLFAFWIIPFDQKKFFIKLISQV